jgi:hypothetical protein
MLPIPSITSSIPLPRLATQFTQMVPRSVRAASAVHRFCTIPATLYSSVRRAFPVKISPARSTRFAFPVSPVPPLGSLPNTPTKTPPPPFTPLVPLKPVGAKFRLRYIWGRRSHTPDDAFLHGAPFATMKVASRSPSVTIPISATHGNGPRRLWSPSPARGRKMSYLALWQTTATAGNRAD